MAQDQPAAPGPARCGRQVVRARRTRRLDPGPYEYGAPARFQYDVPEAFRADLFPLDLERIEAEYMSMIHRLPSSETVGLKDDYNGPICYTPDGNPLVGPAPGLRNMWLAEGFSFGITAAGGTGHYLAQLMTQGEAEIDMASLDPKRYGNWMTTEYAARKNEECYNHVFILHHPDEEREACRPLRTAPAYDRQKEMGAQFGQVNGWERRTTMARRMPRRTSTMTAAASAAAPGGPMRSRKPRRSATPWASSTRRPSPSIWCAARRDGVPGPLHLQQAAERGPDQPDLCPDRPRHHPDGIHHRPAERERILPDLGRRMDGL